MTTKHKKLPGFLLKGKKAIIYMYFITYKNGGATYNFHCSGQKLTSVDHWIALSEYKSLT